MKSVAVVVLFWIVSYFLFDCVDGVVDQSLVNPIVDRSTALSTHIDCEQVLQLKRGEMFARGALKQAQW
jgi:hypothetical protein